MLKGLAATERNTSYSALSLTGELTRLFSHELILSFLRFA